MKVKRVDSADWFEADREHAAWGLRDARELVDLIPGDEEAQDQLTAWQGVSAALERGERLYHLMLPGKEVTYSFPVTATERARIEDTQREMPVKVERWWAFRDALYETEADQELRPEDVKALILEKENRDRLKLEKAHALMAMRDQLDSKAKRQPIPQEVKVAVWQRDQGRCVDCGAQAELEYDHVIPLSMGGSNTERNLQLLCAPCNRRKGGTLG